MGAIVSTEHTKSKDSQLIGLAIHIYELLPTQILECVEVYGPQN